MITELLRVQVGKETTWGTGVTDSAKLMGVSDINLQPGVAAKRFKELRGNLAPAHLAALTKVAPQGSMSQIATYEDICYLLEAMCGVATPSGAGPYVRTGGAPTTVAVATPRFMTAFYDDPGGAGTYKAAGVIPSKLTISGKQSEEMMLKADLLAKQITTGSPASLSDRSVSVVMGSDTKLYVDAWGGTIGTTEMATMSYSYELMLDAQRVLKHYLGALTPGRYVERKWDGELKMMLEFNATSKAFLDALIAPALFQKQVRIKATSDANHIVQLDFAGTAEDTPALFTDDDGVSTLEFTLKGTYHSTLANWFAYSVTNQVSALP